MIAEYIEHMGSDLSVVNSARVSFDKESSYNSEGELSGKDVKLINYLASHNHWTPFSHPQITIREEVPIFVARQRFKHMIGFTYNEVSRRYVNDEPSFYKPVWRNKPEHSIKQGSSGPHADQIDFNREYSYVLDDCLGLYKSLLKRGVAPEQARMVLPQSMMTSYYVTGSLAAWARMYKQRIHETSQVEIQMLANLVGNIIQPLYPISWNALTCRS
jgi:thymidylate synthase (FAD)